MQPTENALAVLEKRYFLPGENWDGLCKRVAKAVSNGDENLEEKYFQAINNFYFLPNSPALLNAGTSIGNLSACFCLDLSDSMESIMDTAKDMSLVFKSGGGVGIDISKLREAGSMVMETNGVASGAVSFMEIYNTVANVTKQGGKRRAALMGVMRVDHPEILDFIKVKNDRTKLNNFNLSVAVTDKFMMAAERGENYDLISPKNGKVGELNAREVFQLIAQNAWENGEPGLLFIDTINSCNPIPQFGKISCTNPCGEIPLLENEACNLLSINLKKLNTFEEIETTVRLGVRFLNGVLDVSTFPTESITKQVAITKKIGLGVMGWADYLAERMIPYDSNKARMEASELMANIKQWAHDESVKIANERNEYIETTMGKRRNGTLLCIAPTGTISMIADCSSSIEPYFALSYTKNVMDGQSLRYINDVLVRKLKEENLWCSEVKDQILKTGSIQHIDTIPDRIKRVFKTANEISIHGHIKMQAAFQEHVDNSISKTINMSSNATVDDVMLAYLEAYRLGVKGITIYRDGSRSGQVLTSPKARIEKCPECQSKSISHDSGCVTCQSCGWSICSI